MTTSLGKLQLLVDKQAKQILKLQERVETLTTEKYEYKRKYETLKKKYDELNNKIDNIIETRIKSDIEKALKPIAEKYEKTIAEKEKRIFELENRLNINSQTSSLPSSKDPLNKPREEIQNNNEKTDRKVGGQPNHPKNKLEKFSDEEITEVQLHKTETCDKCNSSDLEIIEVDERDELDFDIKIKKIRHKFYTCKCRNCGEIIKTEIPPQLHADNQYGSNVKSLIISLYDYGFVSFARTREIIYGLTNGEINPCEGYMVKVQKAAGKMLETFTFDIAEVFKDKENPPEIIQWDDTVVRIGEKEKACFRSYTDRTFVLFKAHDAKDTKGMDEDGILQNLSDKTIVEHDHLKRNYCKDYKYQNAECNAHATRKLKGITVNTNHKWSKEMEDLLKSTLAKRKDYIANEIKSFSKEELDDILKKYDEIVEKGFIEYIEYKHKYDYEKEENLLEFFRDYKENITMWMKNFAVPYSNNFVESLLRMIKTKMKISMQFKSLEHARYFANIRSYVETCGNFGIHKVEALNRLFSGNPYSVKELFDIRNNRKSSNDTVIE